ncbi:hypothetical protein [uncultured Sharpea sp.]|uniref:hypothetical protein n=1 Tax=uncultured Sharpea sp. TaxID=1112738 RepID=UPI00258AA2E4|nr:hypothetical protein [uncultured Sharpea sp.]
MTELNGYNHFYHQNATLKDNEVLMNSNIKKKLPDTIIIKDKTYKVKPVSQRC